MAARRRVGPERTEAALLTGLCFALLFGFAEVAVLGVRRHVFGAFIWTPGPFAWMTPLGYVILFVPIAGSLALLALIRPRWVPPTVPGFVFTLLGVFGSLSMVRAIHPLATGLVALGLATVVGGWVRRREAAWPRILGRAASLGSVLWVAVFGGDLAMRAMAGRPSIEEAKSGGPNVLLIIWDTVRAPSLSLYGYPRETTPFLEELGHRGVVFDHAFSTAPWTLPTHATVFTGRYAHQLSAGWRRPLDDALPTLAEVFSEAGYRTAAFTANWAYTDREKGLARGFERYVDHRRTPSQFILSTAFGQSLWRWLMAALGAEGPLDFVKRLGYVPPFPGRWPDRRVGPDINREFLTWLRDEPGRPYFVFLNYMDAHAPYYAPPDVRARFADDDPHRDRYDAAIFHIDRSMRTLMGELALMGELTNTVVVITSDHGESLGEHGLRYHAASLYLPELHVPLMIVGPGVRAGVRVSQPVGLRDLAATLLDLSDIGDAVLPGRPLTPVWSGVPSEGPSRILAEVTQSIRSPPHYPRSRGDMHALIKGRYHYILNGDGAIELFDYHADPLELNNLIEGGEADSLSRALGRELRAARANR